MSNIHSNLGKIDVIAHYMFNAKKKVGHDSKWAFLGDDEWKCSDSLLHAENHQRPSNWIELNVHKKIIIKELSSVQFN